MESTAYVARAFEEASKAYVLARDWVLLLGPAQHGKTSGLIRIKQAVLDAGLTCALVDLQKQPPCAKYEELLEWFASKTAHEFGTKVVVPNSSHEQKELLGWLGPTLPKAGPVAIIVDEAATIANEAWRNAFYGQLRAVVSERATTPADHVARRIVFLFAGCFRPESLVNERNSPFNVCRKIDSEDLTKEQVLGLTDRILGSGSEPIAGTIYDNVGGQPYLVQTLLTAAASGASEHNKSVEAAIERLKLGDNDHVSRLFAPVLEDERLVEIVTRLSSTGEIANEPANADLRYLQVLGVARRDGQKLVFRNKLYAEIARNSPQFRPGEAINPRNAAIFHLPDSAFDFMHEVKLAEIARSSHRGSVSAYHGGSHRLALVGFGSVLEALLLDWLLSLSPAQLSAAVAKARPTFETRFEVPTDPKTWRLTNLMSVAKRTKTIRGNVEIPKALRDWRNQVHPAVVLANYIDEKQLEPESVIAIGLVKTLVRDLR